MKLANTAILAVGLAILMPGAARARSTPSLGQVEGTITAINRSSTPPTVTIQGRATVTVNVTPTTKIEVGEVHASLASLAVGGVGEAKFDPTTRNAVQIEEAGPAPAAPPAEQEAVAAVVAADAVSGQIMLDGNGDGVTDATLVVTPATEITLGAARLTAAQLALLDGLIIKVEFNGATFVVRELAVDISGATTVTGTLASFDATTGALVLNTATGPVTLTIPAGADVRVGNGGLAAVPAGAALQVTQITNSTGIHVGFAVATVGAGASGQGNSGGKNSHGRRSEPQPGDDRGGHGQVEPGDDRGARAHRGEPQPADDHGQKGHPEVGDDRGARAHRGEVQPGDDRGGHGQPEAGDDRGTRARKGEPQPGDDRRTALRRGQPEVGDDRGARAHRGETEVGDDRRSGRRRGQPEAGDDRGARARKGEPQPGDDRRKGHRRGQPEPGDDRGTRAHKGEPQVGDDHRTGYRRGQPEAGDDRGARQRKGEPQPGDDRGKDRKRHKQPEPGDDHGNDGAGHR